MATSRFDSISWKLTTAFGVLITALVIFQVLYFPSRQAKQATEALRVKAEAVTALVGHDIVAGFEFGDAAAVKEVFKGAENDPDLSFLVLLDESGRQFATFSRNQAIPQVRQLEGGVKSKQELTRDRLTVRRSVTTQTGVHGTLVAGFSTDRIVAERRRNQLMALPVGLALLVPGLAVTLLIARYVSRRLDRLAALAQRVAEGDLTIATDRAVERNGKDEIERLTGAFYFMAANLKLTIRKVIESEGTLSSVSQNVSRRSTQMITGVDQQRAALDNAYETIERLNTAISEISSHVDKLKEAAELTSTAILEMVASQTEIASRTEHLADSVNQTSAATAQTVTAIREVEKNVEFVRSFVTDTSAAVAEMNASIAQVETSAAESFELALTVAQSAEAGRSAVTETIDGMERARRASMKTNEVVARLGERSKEIGEILTVIQSITDQTNLLALNAAILAAQAGVHGAGFSVVADEIRSLSERTTDSTKDIAQLIRTVQEGVRDALAATADGSTVVEQTAKLSISAGEKLSAIIEAATRSLDMGRAIANTTREQARGSGSIGESIARLDDMVRQISTAMSSQADGSTHIMHAIETMRDVTTHTRHATSEQKTTASRIAQAADVVMTLSQQISTLIGDHASESGKIVGAMGEVRAIADGNKESAAHMSESVDGLGLAIQSLDEEVRKFRLEA
ncbi:MAG: HAMP domain-containing methyl-accepting chemotaxis protein [Thermoanaerobaculia bacterium]